MITFTVWSANRLQKAIILLNENEEGYDGLLLKGNI